MPFGADDNAVGTGVRNRVPKTDSEEARGRRLHAGRLFFLSLLFVVRK